MNIPKKLIALTFFSFITVLSFPVGVSAQGTDGVFFNMDLSKYPAGTAFTEDIQRELFGAGGNGPFVNNGQVMIVNDPYGSGKKVLRIELRPGDYGNIITPHLDIYKFGAPSGMREGTSILEVALSDTWGHGPTSIHMPFWRSKRFVATTEVQPDVYAFFHQYSGNNSSINTMWQELGGWSAGPYSKSLIDHQANYYTYDQSSFQGLFFGNFDNPTDYRKLPITRQAGFKKGEYVTQQAHIKLSTPGVKDGFYKGYQNGQLVFDRSNIVTLAAGENESLRQFAFLFYVNGGNGRTGNPVYWNVPDDGVGPKYMYIRTFMLKAGGPVQSLGGSGSTPPTPPTPTTPASSLSTQNPLDLTNLNTENLSLNVSPDSGATHALITLNITDADTFNEGYVIINNRALAVLFGKAAKGENNNTNQNITLRVPVRILNTGTNTFTFKHRSSDGYLINSVRTSFETEVVEPGGGTSGPHAAFANVPIPAGAMNFSWFEDVTASYGSSVQDDPVNWTTLYQQANRKIEVSSCGALKTAVNNARAGDIIVVANGTYNDCNVSFTKSGTQSNPIVITSEAKALGQSGGVTFRGANVFGTFSNQASHYIIGGFRFEDQGNIAFKLNDGAPDAVNSTNVRFTDSHFEGIGAKRGSNDAVIAVGMRNNNIRIDHNSFVSNYNHPRFESGDPADGVSKNGRIDHNYFGPAATTGFLNGVPYEIGAIQTCCGKANPNVNQLTLLVEYNVAEHKRSGNTGNTDGEVFEIKSNGATVRNNIIWGDDRSAVSLRQSHNSVIEGNYLVGTGIIISGAYHTIRNNEVRAISEMRQGIIMSRWGRRQPDNCTTLPETHDNTVENNTIVGTTDYGIRIGDCDYGACRPVYDSVFRNNTVQAISGQDIYLNTKNEPGRTTSCSNDRPGDADGGVNTGIVIHRSP